MDKNTYVRVASSFESTYFLVCILISQFTDIYSHYIFITIMICISTIVSIIKFYFIKRYNLITEKKFLFMYSPLFCVFLWNIAFLIKLF